MSGGQSTPKHSRREQILDAAAVARIAVIVGCVAGAVFGFTGSATAAVWTGIWVLIACGIAEA